MSKTTGSVCSLVVVIAVVLLGAVRSQSTESDYSAHIQFDVFNSAGNNTFSMDELTDDTLDDLDKRTGCDVNGKLAFLVPGWLDDGDEDWVLELVHNYLEFRGGCVCVMKYGYYALDSNYFEVLREFDSVASVLTTAIRSFLLAGFQARRTYLFGFSMGARVAVYAASQLKNETASTDPNDLLEQIDCCDPAGYGFDGTAEHSGFQIVGLAKRVTCLHTSCFFGTSERRCDYDWNLGECGKHQPAAKSLTDSHKLCTRFWIAAFQHKFPAVAADAEKCGVDHRAVKKVADSNGPYCFGYQNSEIRYPKGTYYANTYAYPPYNVKIAHPPASEATAILGW